MKTVDESYAENRASGQPCSYFGDHGDWLCFLGVHRDSDSLSRSNFEVARRELAALDESGELYDIERAGHWAVGWVDVIIIHPEAEALIAFAEETKAALENYPVLDDEHFSELEHNEAAEYWASEDVSERVRIIQHTKCGASVFAARRDELPCDDNGSLLEYLSTP